jgi:hypothetical protein
MEPTIAEMIFWGVIGIGGLLALVIAPFLNPHYDPKGDDPYRYCPKEDEE